MPINTEVLKSSEQMNEVSGNIIASAIEVHRHMGPGLLESVYAHCLLVELRSRGLTVHSQVPVKLTYKSLTLEKVLMLDLLVESEVIVELKSVDCLTSLDYAQLLSYLKLSNKRLGLLINFNVVLLKDGVKRIVNQF